MSCNKKDKIKVKGVMMKERIFKGTLTEEKGKYFLLGKAGKKHLKNDLIWSGYIKHWLGKKLCARYLPQRDYKKGKPIVIMWPDEPVQEKHFVDLYYNERLVKYTTSILGHIAINIDGEIFNFSHLLNENEIISPEEYFYRPALGEFAPHPELGVYNIDNKERPYLDKFGRLFMRTIHVLRIEGINTIRLSKLLHEELDNIHKTPINPKKPEKYRDFNVFTQSCTTIIRNSFREYGFKGISGIFPLDLFINTAYTLLNKVVKGEFRVKLFRMKQLKVPESPYSELTPILNLRNKFKLMRLPKY